MNQIEIWEGIAEDLSLEKKQLFWADKMCSICEYMTMETRIKNIAQLLPMMEDVCDRYNKARVVTQETEKNA
jgi:hypothetical protein